MNCRNFKIVIIVCLIVLGFVIGLLVGRSREDKPLGTHGFNENVKYDEQEGLADSQDESDMDEGNTTDKPSDFSDSNQVENDSDDDSINDDEATEQKDKYELPEF